jgi:hypothetical protein
MTRTIAPSSPVANDRTPVELADLMAKLGELPAEVREMLAPAVEEAVEQAKFRSRVLDVARDALEHLRLELEMTRFDLELTRKERESLRSMAS